MTIVTEPKTRRSKGARYAKQTMKNSYQSFPPSPHMAVTCGDVQESVRKDLERPPPPHETGDRVVSVCTRAVYTGCVHGLCTRAVHMDCSSGSVLTSPPVGPYAMIALTIAVFSFGLT